ncbi:MULTISPECIES: MFS transporter [Bacillus]|uniref:MFS transporter n=1 Tax=Bacillus TaxID=1386 RepID=UPI000BB90851|nr:MULTISPECIES: MFS transporter [Bacillus]
MNKKVFLYSKALSDFGSFMDLLVLNVLVLVATGSPVWLAATMAARTIGGVVGSLMSGIVADRYNRRKVMIVTDFLRAGIILLLIPFHDPIMILIASFSIGLISSFFMVSFSSEIPQIFGQNKIIETNSLISRLTSISLVLGFIGAGVISELLGYKLTLAIDAATYAISGVVLMMMKWDTQTTTNTVNAAKGVVEKIHSVFVDMKEVYKYLKVAPMLFMVNIVFLIGAFAGSSHNLGIPLLAESLNEERQTFYYGMIWGVWGIGSVLATYTLPKLTIVRDDRIFFVCFISAILMSVGFISFLSTTIIAIVFIFAFITGVFDASFTTLHTSILQKADNHIRGRVFAVGMLLKSLGFASGFIVAPIVLKELTMPQMVWIFHGTLISVTLVIFLISYRWNKQNSLSLSTKSA